MRAIVRASAFFIVLSLGRDENRVSCLAAVEDTDSYDPLRLLEDADEEVFGRLRRAQEIQFRRTSLLGVVGYLVTVAGIRLPGSIDFTKKPPGREEPVDPLPPELRSISKPGTAQIIAFISSIENAGLFINGGNGPKNFEQSVVNFENSVAECALGTTWLNCKVNGFCRQNGECVDLTIDAQYRDKVGSEVESIDVCMYPIKEDEEPPGNEEENPVEPIECVLLTVDESNELDSCSIQNDSLCTCSICYTNNGDVGYMLDCSDKGRRGGGKCRPFSSLQDFVDRLK